MGDSTTSFPSLYFLCGGIFFVVIEHQPISANEVSMFDDWYSPCNGSLFFTHHPYLTVLCVSRSNNLDGDVLALEPRQIGDCEARMKFSVESYLWEGVLAEHYTDSIISADRREREWPLLHHVHYVVLSWVSRMSREPYF